MLPKQPPRPGLEQLRQAGEEWQAEKLADLSDTFGNDYVIGDRYNNAAGETSTACTRDFLKSYGNSHLTVDTVFARWYNRNQIGEERLVWLATPALLRKY